MRQSIRVSKQTPQPVCGTTFWGRLKQTLCLGAALGLALVTAPNASAQGQTAAPAKRTTNQAAKKTQSGRPAAKKPKPDDMAWLREALKDPELMKEVNHLTERLMGEMHYPTPRTRSALLARLPQSTALYVALPNFGPQLHQASQIFHEELQSSAPLRNFLEKNKALEAEAKFEDGMQMFFDFSEYLGDEFVVTGEVQGKEPTFALMAEIKKPGLRAFLENLDRHLNTGSSDHLRILEPQQLASATESGKKDEPLVLLRPDMLIVGFNLASVRDMNAQLDHAGPTFASGGLGRRVAKSYEAGTTTVFGADLQKFFTLIPSSQMQARMILDKTGFGDAQYAIMDGTLTGKDAANNMELVFSGPRHGVASWLASPAALGSLDFVSSKSALAEVIRLKSPAKILDDIVEIAGPQALAMLPQMEAQMNINLKQDILSKLTGEIGIEFETSPMMAVAQGSSGKPGMQGPGNFKVILGVSDPAGLQQTVKRLLAQAPLPAGEREEGGVTFYTLTTPGAGGATQEFNYFFLDGYLVIASTREMADEAVRVHRSGNTMAKSGTFGKAGQVPVASGLVYQNAGPMLAAMLSQAPPEIASLVGKALSEGKPSVNIFYAYADENRIRATTNSSVAMDTSVVMIAAAIAIPNLLKAKMSANESAAIATVRTINTAEVTYQVSYPHKGYAATLAAMGPGGGDCTDKNVTAAHACLLDEAVGGADCTAGKWCAKGGYRYSIRGVCTQVSCRGYVVTATPINENTGGKSFCSTADAVIRRHEGPPLTTPLTAAECKAWGPIK